MATTMVHGRVEEDVKRKAGKVLAALGLRPSDVIRVLFTRIAKDKTLPFDVCPLPHVPNAKTRAAIEGARQGGKRRAFANVADLMADLNADD